jgi:carbonic anhydrase
MEHHKRLLLENKAWAREKKMEDPEFFSRLVHIQKPEFLWIGCSDSRVPPNEITQTQPGEIFIHRNVANLVLHADLNMLSVLQYAVEVLEVKHVIVCGHYGCGGVKAAMGRSSLGIINKWLRHIKDVYRFHQDEIDPIEDKEARLNRLIELNVEEQVMNLAKTSIIQQSWHKYGRPHLHGWVYDLSDGIIKVVKEMPPNTHLDHPIYEYDNLEGPLGFI